MALTDRAIRAAKAADKPFKLGDSGGLFLLVTPTGRLWRWKFRLGGRAQQMSFGAYPEVSLAEAREQRDRARAELRAGRDPRAARRAAKLLGTSQAGASFEAAARAWHGQNRSVWTERHAADVIGSLERLVFPAIGRMHVNDITAPMVLGVLRRIEGANGGETAQRVRQRVSAVFVHAIASGVATADPAAVVKGALAAVVKGRQPAITDLSELRAMLQKAEAEPAHPVTLLALRFLALTVVRPGELRGAQWCEIEGLDGPAPVWRIPAPRMKMRAEHVVPLTPAALDVLAALRPLTGRSPFLFPNSRWHHKEMSGNAVGYLLNRAGYHHRHCPHGFRAAFSSVMNDRHPGEHDAIEACLAHAIGGVRGAYLRSTFDARRRALHEEWATLILDGAPSAADLLRGPRRPLKVAA